MLFPIKFTARNMAVFSDDQKSSLKALMLLRLCRREKLISDDSQ
jgi:hypothetical protein